MSLPEIVRRTAEKLLSEFCEREISSPSGEEIRLRFEMEGTTATLCEERRPSPSAPWTARPVARFGYHGELSQWTLHYPGPTQRWHFYLNAGPSLDLGKLLRTVEDDPLGVFGLSPLGRSPQG